MAFTKITNTELNSRGATTLPNQPTISATALKQEFDAPAKNIVAPKFNNLIDELEAAGASASLGIQTPTGRTGNTIQSVVDDISDDLATVEASMPGLIGNEHNHDNKALLDTYTQTETDLADAVSRKHSHSNKVLLDTYTQTESDLADAVSRKHSHSNKALLDTYTQTESDLADAVSKKHSHANKTQLDKIGESAGGHPTYSGKDINGSIDNSFAKVKVNATTLTSSGEGTLELKEGTNITLVPNSSDNSVTIYSSGGSGGGDMLKSVYAPTNVTGTVDKAITLYDGTNTLQSSIPDLNFNKDINISSPADGELLTYDGVNGKWENKAPDKSFVRYAGSKSYSDLMSGTGATGGTYLSADYEDMFFLCGGGTIADATELAKWTSSYNIGDVIPADSHIAIINVGTDIAPDYRFDDFGGYVDISGKADKENIPITITVTATVAAGSNARIPASGTNSNIKTTSTVIPLFDPSQGTIKHSGITVYNGYAEIKMAQAISSKTVGILVINN